MATYDKKFISAITLLDEVEYNPLVVDIQNENGLMDILKLADRYEVSKNPIYHDWVNSALRVQGDTTGATVSGSGTATVTTTLTTGTSGFARKTDLVKFPNGKVGYVTNVTTSGGQDTLTIKSADGSNLTHTASQKLDFFSNASGEGSTAPAARRYSLTEYNNHIQTFRESDEITDIQKASAVRVTYNGSPYIYMKNWNEKIKKFRGDINGAFIGGVKGSTKFEDSSPSITDPNNGGAVQFTGGLDWYTTSYGVSDSVASAGTWALADLYDLESQLLAKKAQGPFMLLCGTKVKSKLQDTLKNLGSGGVTSARLNIDGKEVNMQVDKFSYGFDYEIAKMGIMDSPEYFSQTDIVKSFYLVPKDDVATADGGRRKRITAMYMPHGVGEGKNLGNSIIGEWQTGAMAPNSNSDEMKLKTHWISNQGLRIVGAQHMAKSVVL